MAYTKLGQNIISYFTPTSQPYVNIVSNSTTGFKINNIDISSNYLALGSSSKIPISQIFTTNYSISNNDLSNLYELYLTNYVGTKDVDYKIWNPTNHAGLLIQFLKTTTISFKYNVSLNFVMIGGGGGGGGTNNGQAGGGGGAGELITGKMSYILANTIITFTIGTGGTSNTDGNDSSILCNGNTITANGGGAGAIGGSSSLVQTGSSSGGSGSAGSTLQAGVATDRTIANIGYFNTMISYNNTGGAGHNQGNSSGAGGGGGGSGGVGGAGGSGLNVNAYGGSGGIGSTITFGSTNFLIGGGGGGGARDNNNNGGGRIGGYASYGGGTGGGLDTSVTEAVQAGISGTTNTGGGGGGGGNSGTGPNNGGTGGSGTIILYITPTNVEPKYDVIGTYAYTETYNNGFYMVTFTSSGTIKFNRNIPILSVIVLGSGGGGGYGSTSAGGGGGGLVGVEQLICLIRLLPLIQFPLVHQLNKHNQVIHPRFKKMHQII